jgi:hypothetical protein
MAAPERSNPAERAEPAKLGPAFLTSGLKGEKEEIPAGSMS